MSDKKTKKATKKTAKKTAKKPAKKTAKKPAKKSPVATKEPKPTPKPSKEKSKPTVQPATIELVDIEAVAKLLRLPLLRVKKMVRSGQIPGVKVDGVWKFNLRLVQQAMLRRSRGK
ncbi:MAG: helix-turn-helix domain-containing protein [Deltaproteobacteria bacterium]|nr:helix-turn-helix domain-containing protein [Deltaproteobacteria bacterium]